MRADESRRHSFERIGKVREARDEKLVCPPLLVDSCELEVSLGLPDDRLPMHKHSGQIDRPDPRPPLRGQRRPCRLKTRGAPSSRLTRWPDDHRAPVTPCANLHFGMQQRQAESSFIAATTVRVRATRPRCPKHY